MNMVYFIRHGLTAGNEKKRYIGKTDEPLSEQGSAQLKGKTAPRVDVVAVSPMLRCMQTAQILYPRQKYRIVEDFRECDFGTFEGKNYLELSDDPAYQAWIDSNGKNAFPQGEDPQKFKERCAAAFAQFMQSVKDGSAAALVVHGGTIMAILSAFDRAKKDFYDYHLSNGQGIEAVWENGGLTVGQFLW